VIRETLEGLLDLLAPRRCPGCDVRLDWGLLGFCSACAPLLDRLPHGAAAYDYGGPLAEGIARLKYERRLDLVEPLAALLRDAGRGHRGKVDALVPVPLHPSRRQRRGFDQVELLAAPLARDLGVPLETRWLRRIRDTAVQASLPERDRDANVRGAFEGTPRDGKVRVLLVDDVRTTGATLRAASAALYRSSASQVRLLTLAGVA